MQHGIPECADDPKRVIAATVADLRIVCLYAPNGQSLGSDKYAYKLAWFAALAAWNQEAFGAKSAGDALKSLGAASPAPSKDIVIEALKDAGIESGISRPRPSVP